MKKRWKKIAIGFVSILIIGFIGMIVFSPFGNKKDFSYKLVLNTVEINAPVDSVYRFLGHSSNAAKWSVFVNHIIPLNNNEVPDGKAGSRRRCFQNADEKGLQWDELITVVEPLKRRQLTIYNMQGFQLQADNLATEQLYDSIAPQKTKLSFTLFYKDAEPSLGDLLKTYYAAYKVKSIYEKNMANIKRIVETGS